MSTVTPSSMSMLFGDLHQCFHDGPDVGTVDPRGAENDSRMGTSLLNGVMTERTEVPRIAVHHAPPLSGGEDKLLLVPKPDGAHFMNTDGVHAPLPERDSNGGCQILIEVELHARRAIASCMARP